ncbi:MAG: CTP synthase, partial [Parcubacteria group bacterium Gr01-1014_66]
MIGEMKTKPTQHAVRSLNTAGIQPDIILARSSVPLDKPRKQKVSIFCNMQEEDIISAPDVSSIYEVPLNFEKERLGDRLLKKFRMPIRKKKDLVQWTERVRQARNTKNPVKIGIVGKYFNTGTFTLSDSYISVLEALKHAAWAEKRVPELHWLSAEEYEHDPKALWSLRDLDGIVVPGGFGSRGVEGKIRAIEFCRKNLIPFFGLCYGMHLAVVEFARNVAHMEDAHTTEVNPNTKHPVIDILPEQKENLAAHRMGGSMRLGSYACRIQQGTKAYEAYNVPHVKERHRHRWELNNTFRERLIKKGLVISGINPERGLVEIIEIAQHPFFMATQFHPELQSRFLKPHPLFLAFVQASIKKRGGAN